MSSASLPLLVVLGATGNQGGSVISHFLHQSPATYRLRGLTRNTSSATSQAMSAKGVDMVAADVDDFSSLQRAFEGASAIFAVTDFWGKPLPNSDRSAMDVSRKVSFTMAGGLPQPLPVHLLMKPAGPYHDPKNVNKGKENDMLRNKWAYYNELQQGRSLPEP